jgi:hypothetical protein
LFEYFFTTPAVDGEQEYNDDLEVISLLDPTIVIESGVTSGADPNDWDPVRIDQNDKDGEDQDEKEKVVSTDLTTDSQPAGVTSGSDSVIDDNGKSSERKNKQR